MPWHMAQVVKDKIEHAIGDLNRPRRGHPPVEAEGSVGAGETA
jgi:hypothetical protein